uniref:Eclosion hormone n=1 Tax=Strigamia maritima TaxID=126957 RepID=T1JCY5_STRMM
MRQSESQRAAVSTVVILLLLHLDRASSRSINLCIQNCAQCKKMFGPYFEGQLCAETCIELRAKMTPDCADANSISPFLNKFER